MSMFAESVLRGEGDFSPDLDNYFRRIRYEGAHEPTLASLNGIVYCHLESIPFENLSIHLNNPIIIDDRVIEDKVVNKHRGGYCFELNSLLLSVLRKIGFQVVPLFARVRWNYPANQPTGNTHLVLKVDVEGVAYLVDVAFGGMSPSCPLIIETTDIQETPTKDLRRILRTEEGGFLQQVCFTGSVWTDCYYFTLQESFPIDWKISSHFCSTSLDILFTKCFVVSIIGKEGRHNILNKCYNFHRFDGGKIQKDIETEAELLESIFGLILPEGSSLCPPGEVWS